MSNGIPRTEHDLKHLTDISTYVNYCTKDVFGSFRFREAVRKYFKPTRIERSFDQSSKETYHNIFTEISADLNGSRNQPDQVKRVSTSFPISVSHTGKVFKDNPRQHNDTTRPETSETIEDSDLFYIHYLDHTDFKSWHDSYRYLISIVSDRVEMDTHCLQEAVQCWESILFED